MATPDPAFYRHPCRSHIGRRIMNDEEIEGEIDRRIKQETRFGDEETCRPSCDRGTRCRET